MQLLWGMYREPTCDDALRLSAAREPIVFALSSCGYAVGPDLTPQTPCRVVKGANYVYHCAASLDFETYNVGVGGRKKLVESAVESQLDIIRVSRSPLWHLCVLVRASTHYKPRNDAAAPNLYPALFCR